MKLSIKIFLLFAVLLILDGMIVTPIAIKYFNAYEANPYQSIGVERWGLGYFYVAIPLILLIIFVLILGVENLSYNCVRKNEWNEKYKNLPLYAMGLLGFLTFGYTILNNIWVILT